MSLQSILAGDTVSVQQRAAVHRDASGGIQAGGWGVVAGISGSKKLADGTTASGPFIARVEDLSADQLTPFAMRGMSVDTVVYTQQAGIGMGMLITTSDNRKLLVEGVKYNRAIGGMPLFYEIRTSEYRPGA